MNINMNTQQPTFKAKLQISGNLKLLNDRQHEIINIVAKKIGDEKDIIDIKLPYKKNGGEKINVAKFANGNLQQFSKAVKNNDYFNTIMSTLEKIKKEPPKVKKIQHNKQNTINRQQISNEKSNNIFYRAPEKLVEELTAFYETGGIYCPDFRYL